MWQSGKQNKNKPQESLRKRTKASRKRGVIKIGAYNNKPESGSLTKSTKINKMSARLTKVLKKRPSNYN